VNFTKNVETENERRKERENEFKVMRRYAAEFIALSSHPD
jgi:hypothetical protein